MGAGFYSGQAEVQKLHGFHTLQCVDAAAMWELQYIILTLSLWSGVAKGRQLYCDIIIKYIESTWCKGVIILGHQPSRMMISKVTSSWNTVITCWKVLLWSCVTKCNVLISHTVKSSYSQIIWGSCVVQQKHVLPVVWTWWDKSWSVAASPQESKTDHRVLYVRSYQLIDRNSDPHLASASSLPADTPTPASKRHPPTYPKVSHTVFFFSPGNM